MKIFSQSTACGLLAVVNGLSIRPVSTPGPAVVGTLIKDDFLPNTPRPANPAPVYNEFQLYGGWDLPVPQPREDEFIRIPGMPYIADQRTCYMGHLPKRGEIGEMKKIQCWSDDLSAFRIGNGPRGFTGFYASVGWPRDHCYLVKDGKLTPLMENCHQAVKNLDAKRFLQEDLSYGNWGQRPMGGDKYFY